MTPLADEKHLNAIPDSPEELWEKCYSKNFGNEKEVYLKMFPLFEEINENHKTIRVLNNERNIKQRIYYFARELGNNVNEIVNMCQHKKRQIEAISKEIAIGNLEPVDVFLRVKKANAFPKNNILIADLVWRLSCIRSTESITLGIPQEEWLLE